MQAKLSTKKSDTVLRSTPVSDEARNCAPISGASMKSNAPASTVMKSQAKNHGTESRVPSTVTAPTGASRPQRLTPEELTKLPIDHCIANGVKRMRPSCSNAKSCSLRKRQYSTMVTTEHAWNVNGIAIEYL